MNHLSRNMEKTLGSGIQWTKVPSVKSVMKAVKTRIRLSVLAAAASIGLEDGIPDPSVMPPAGPVAVLPGAPAEPDTAVTAEAPAVIGLAGSVEGGGDLSAVPPVIAQLSRELTERLGAEQAVTALISMTYGEQLDPSRYGMVVEIPEQPLREEKGRFGLRGAFKRGGQSRYSGGRHEGLGESFPEGNRNSARVYVGLGRQHGASARDVAALLTRAGGVPGRLVDAIEMKDYCAFATMPVEAARRACVFSRNTPGDPAIKLAKQ
jgi:ATP-dependent RNA helicase DeaD